MVGVVGIASRIFGALAKEKINVILITQASSEHSVCLAILPQFGQLSKNLIEEGRLPLVGMVAKTNSGIFNGPLYYYFISFFPIVLLSRQNDWTINWRTFLKKKLL